MLADNRDFEAGETLLEEEERIVNDDAPPPPLRASCMACVLSSVCWEGQEEV
jgi:CRISPR/Cas system-associated exonuclease Cas4 (RecB family)